MADVISLQEFYGGQQSSTAPAAGPTDAAPAAIPMEQFYAQPPAPPQQLATPKEGMPSLIPQFAYGLRKPIDAGAQLLARGVQAVAPSGSSLEDWAKGQTKSVEDINQAAAASADAQRIGMPNAEDAARFAGQAATTAPLAGGTVGGSLLARVGAGAATGGAQGALQPIDTSNDDGFWRQKLEQTATGAGAGGTIPLVGGALARVISPEVNPSVQLLMKNGITPTPGQILGPVANRVEEGATSIPFVGDAIKAARGRAVADLNTAAINDALSPIGQKLSEDTGAGREAIAEAGSKIRDSYNALVPALTAKADPTFTANIANLRNMAQSMTPDRATQFNKVLDDQVLSKFSPNGTISGESFKDAESTLGRLASEYRNSAVADERQVGGAFLQTQKEMRDLLTRNNPQQAQALQANDLAYAKFLRVQDAAASLGTNEGVFSPAQLLGAVKKNDQTLHNRAFAQGSAMTQDLAEAGKSVLGNKVPDSGTPFRTANIAAIMGAVPAFTTHPLAATAATGTGALAMGAYTTPAQKAIAAILTKRPDIAAPLSQAVRRGSAIGAGYAPIPLSSMVAPGPQ